MDNIDINLKNSKFYIIEVVKEDYNNGDYFFNTYNKLFLFKKEAEKIKNEIFKEEVNNLSTEDIIYIPENLEDYDKYNTNNTYVINSGFNENSSWIDIEDKYLYIRIKELFLNNTF